MKFISDYRLNYQEALKELFYQYHTIPRNHGLNILKMKYKNNPVSKFREHLTWDTLSNITGTQCSLRNINWLNEVSTVVSKLLSEKSLQMLINFYVHKNAYVNQCCETIHVPYKLRNKSVNVYIRYNTIQFGLRNNLTR